MIKVKHVIYRNVDRNNGGFPSGFYGKKKKNLLANAGDSGDLGLIPGSGRYSGGGNGNPLQYSCLANPMDREAWKATVLGVTEPDMTKHTLAHIQTQQNMLPG